MDASPPAVPDPPTAAALRRRRIGVEVGVGVTVGVLVLVGVGLAEGARAVTVLAQNLGQSRDRLGTDAGVALECRGKFHDRAGIIERRQ
jgi:hypothetical protein